MGGMLPEVTPCDLDRHPAQAITKTGAARNAARPAARRHVDRTI
jgi:hypothetical protein